MVESRTCKCDQMVFLREGLVRSVAPGTVPVAYMSGPLPPATVLSQRGSKSRPRTHVLWKSYLHPQCRASGSHGGSVATREHSGSYSRLLFISRLSSLFCKMGLLIMPIVLGGAADGAAQIFPAVEGIPVSGYGPSGCHIAPHLERDSVPPSSWQPHAVGESRARALSRPELKSQPARYCGMPGLRPGLSEQSGVCPLLVRQQHREDRWACC